MHIKEHEAHCEKELGKPFTEVHIFLDQFAIKYNMNLVHRTILHHHLGVALVGLLMGQEATGAAKLHVVDDVHQLPVGPEWFLRLPAYMPHSGQEDSLEADMQALLGYAPNFNAAWAGLSRKLKCSCGYTGPLRLLIDNTFECPWCTAVRTERFDTLRKLAVGKKRHG